MIPALAAFVGTVLAFDKETLMIGAFASMIVAGLFVALGAIVLFRREGRSRH